MQSAEDLERDFIFGLGRGFSNMSNVGRWMMSLSVAELATVSDSVYILTAGAYPIQAATMNYCGGLNGNYSVPDLALPVQLAVVDDGMTYLRGDALSHWYSNDLVDNLPTKKSKMADMQTLGYNPARMQADLRMTTGLPIQNTTKTQNFAVPFYRVYSKSYCTGYVPLATLGHGTCNLTVQFVQGSNTVVMTKSFSVPSSTHHLGLMFRRSIYSTIGAVLKYVAILIAMAGFLASRRTVQWHERSPDKVESVTEKLMDMVVPKYFPRLSYAIRFDLFCYNSDLFVLLFVVSNVLDMNQAIQYIREVNAYNALSPQLNMTIQLFSLSTRLLWLNVGLVKTAKMALHLMSSATYSGHSRVMCWLNFSSVMTLYLSAILLFFVADYIEYNNISRWDITNSFESLNGCFIDYFQSFYFRGAPAIGIGLALNVAGVLAVDHLVLIKFWRNLAKNSLGRQVIFNTTCITCEFVGDFTVEKDGSAVIHCKARRLSTLQWYFMSQTLFFGLPEKELSKKKYAPGQAVATTKGDESSIHLREQGKGDIFHVITRATTDTFTSSTTNSWMSRASRSTSKSCAIPHCTFVRKSYRDWLCS